MSRLIIKNIGPIKNIDINLNKINVFIGPQSSGKSTIAKIASYCSWMEKENGSNRKGLVKELESYHKLKGYFSEHSAILYMGENVTFIYNGKNIPELPDDLKVYEENFADETLLYTEDKTIRPKVSYIPAERNFVAAIPNSQKYAEENDYLKNFIEEWLESKRHYPSDKAMDIINLGVKYYYNEKNDRDMLLLDDKSPILLEKASSGLQSVVPLILLIDWASNGIYEQNKPYSPEEIMRMKQILSDLSKEQKEGSGQQLLLDQFKNIMDGKGYTHTQFVVEEPEQNLFPKTQVDFLYFLLSRVNHGRPHRLLLTTHSPYILYALNNCMLAHLVKSYIDPKDLKTVGAIHNSVNPKDVSVWQIKDGCLCNEKGEYNKTIQDGKGLIRKNFFNEIMKQVMGEFNELLNYYE